MLTPIKKESGLTLSERYLAELANKTFLSLWSYPNVYTDEGILKNKSGKELCDLLVVFDNKVIVFSDKDISFKEHRGIDTAWGSWYRKSVLKSADQLFGAEKWIRQFSDRIYLDKDCRIKFPVDIEIESMEIHLVAVTKTLQSHSVRYFNSIAGAIGESSGSFIQIYNEEYGVETPPLFTIGDLYKNKSFVHVFDEISLTLLMSELDTIHDFVSYLTDKVKLIRSGVLFASHGEEDLLAFHLIRKINTLFGVPDEVFASEQGLILQEGLWKIFQSAQEYKIHNSYKAGGRLIDFWLNLFSRHILTATVGHGADVPFSVHEKAVRFLASENRMSRCTIGEAFEWKLNNAPFNVRSSRLIFSPIYPDRLYILLVLPLTKDVSLVEYRDIRRKLMQAYAVVAKYRYENIKYVAVIATEPKASALRSEDVILFDFLKDLSAAEKAQAQAFMKDGDILADIQVLNKSSKFNLKAGRNSPCPCGSGKKYKKCCLN